MRRIAVLLIMLGICVATASAEDAWADTDCAKRVMITVTNSPNIDGYQGRISVDYLAGMQNDFDDVKFYTSTGAALKQYCESKTDGENAIIWVNIPQSSNYIYAYYSDIDGISADDSSLFDFFEHFDTALDYSKWDDELNGNGGIISDSVYALVFDGDMTKGIISDSEYGEGYRAVFKAKIYGGNCVAVGFKNSGTAINGYSCFESFLNKGLTTDQFGIALNNGGTPAITLISGSVTDYQIIEVDRSYGSARFFVDGTEYTPSSYTQDPTCSLKISLCANNYADTGYLYCDYVLVAKSLETRPTYTIGDPETYSEAPTPTPTPALPHATLQARPVASATIAPLDDVGYYLLNSALGLNEQYNESAGTGALNPRGVFNASMYPFTGGDYGDYASLLIFAVPFLLAWMRQNSAIIPMSFGCILGTWMLWKLPAEWQLPATGMIILSMMGILYGIYKEKY